MRFPADTLFAASLPFTCLTQNILPLPNGTFSTSLKTTLLIDESRLDPFAPSPELRAIAISTFYPLPATKRCTLSSSPYMPPLTAAFEDQAYAVYGVPNGTFAKLRLSTCNDNTAAAAHHPIVLFSPALGTSRFVYNALAQTVASAGYIVITIDHPYDADVVEFPSGRLVFGLNITDAMIDLAVDTRAKDASFVLGQLSRPCSAAEILPLKTDPMTRLDVSRVGFYGHSLGGAAAAAGMFRDGRVVAGMDLDGSVFGPVVNGGLDRPFLLFGRVGHNRTSDATWATLWPNLRAERIELSLAQAAHYTFSDLPFLAGFLGFRDQLAPGVVDGFLGTLDGRRALEIVAGYVVKFMDEVLKGKRVVGLKEPDRAFPEVSILA
ncbi:hypothetical protein MMC25_000888 [Agyrium rufum]|nr:hypothetical protein [Agyrium rufum]